MKWSTTPNLIVYKLKTWRFLQFYKRIWIFNWIKFFLKSVDIIKSIK